LIAEEVAKVNPALIPVEKEGKPYSVRYEHLNAMLLNEFLKEHRAFVEQQHKLARQQEEIDSLNSELKKQRSLIDRVTTRLEASQPATKVATREP
jgi:septal ring factor EnvC (AmiA/AmiB activator)